MAFTKVVGPGIHTQSNIVSHNINSSGIITATQFDGPFSNVVVGGATTLTVDGINISAGILTAQTLDVNGNGDISGNLVVGGNLTANGDFTTLNTTLREVELLRVDANSNLAAGIVTQRGSGNILDLYDTSTNVLSVKDGGDLDIAQYVRHLGSTGETFGFPATGNRIIATTNGSTRFTLDGDGRILVGITTATFLSQGGSDLLIEKAVGAGGTVSIDLYSKNATGNAFLRFYNGSHSGKIGIVGIGHSMIFCVQGVNSERMRLTSTGLGVGTTIPSRKLDVSGDILGNAFMLRGNTSASPSIQAQMYRPANNTLAFATDGNNERLRITSDGDVGISSTAPRAKLDVKDANTSKSVILRVSADNNTPYALIVGNDTFNTSANRGLAMWIGSSTVHHIEARTSTTASENKLEIEAYETKIQTGTSLNNDFIFDSSGHLLPGAAGAQNLGSASAEWGDVYLGDDKRLTLGSDQDMYVYHDNIHGYVSNRKNNLYLSAPNYVQIVSTDTSGSNQKTGARFLRDGESEIYHSNSLKFTTTGIGVSVIGEVAATQDYPNFRPTLDLNFAAVKKLDPRITYTRSGPASFTDEFGKLIKVAANAPRFDHNFGTGESLGLLIEESSTNISRYSEKASGTTNWTQFGSITENIIEAPDGTMTADKLEAPASGHGLINIALSWTANVPHTFSIFAKSGEFNRIGIRLYDGTSYFMRTTVNLDTGEAVNNEAGTLNVEKFANGWWRISTTGTPVATYNYNSLGSVEPHKNATVQSPDPSNSREGIYIWGWQMEAKAFPTSYIPTNGVAVTRGGDNVDIDGENFTDFYNQTESTIISSHTLLPNVPNAENVYVYQIQDASTNNVIRVIDKNSSYSNVATGLVLNGGSSQFHFNNTTDSYTKDKVLVALSVKQDDFAGCHNGGDLSLDNSGTLPTNMNSLGIGRYPPTNGYELNGHIQRFIYYPKQLPDSQLKTLTL